MQESSPSQRALDRFLTTGPALGFQPRTIEEYGRVLGHLTRAAPAWPHDPATLAGYVYGPTAQGRPAQPPLVRLRLAALRSWYRWAVLMGETSTDPTRRLPTPPRLEHVAEAPTLPALRAWLRRLEPTPRAVAMLLILTGHRFRELLSLTWTDLGQSWTSSTASTFYPLRVKGGRIVRCHLPPAAVPFLERLRGQDQSFVVPWSAQRLRHAFREAGGIRPHALRHATAQIHLELGASVAEIRDLLLHKSIASTETYVRHGHPTPDRLAGRVARLILQGGSDEND